MTFSALSRLADFKSELVQPINAEPIDDAGQQYDDAKQELKRDTGRGKSGLGGLHYNIQVILPETRDMKVYDAIFRSLREHLL